MKTIRKASALLMSLVISAAALGCGEQEPAGLNGDEMVTIGPQEAQVAGGAANLARKSALTATSSALAPITDRSGIPAGATNVEFDEAGLAPFSGIRVTTQFEFLGVTFSDIISGVGGFTFTPETGFPGVNDNSNLGNFGGGLACALARGPSSLPHRPPLRALIS